jgi:hypothetical protein
MYQDLSIKTLADCEKVAYEPMKEEPSDLILEPTEGKMKIISTTKFENRSIIFRECRACVMKKMKLP